MEDQEVQQNNMISNLPLLFANGYPTSLDKITESQLQNFIPFMVQCSLGHINLQGQIDYSEPEWWPENLQFTIPFTKPKKFLGNWIDKMKEVVIICYQFHKSVFLLRFCNDLAAYEHASLRFINNYNSTTSLFDRRSNKLLVTFRNENMSYDQPQKSRKCLLQQKSKNGHRVLSNDDHRMMVEPAPFDIYLCDNCDAELYSKQAILEHEKTCVLDADDVILCDTPEPLEENQLNLLKNNENNELRIGFLLNFSLQCRKNVKKPSCSDDSAKLQEKCMDYCSGISSKDDNYIVLEKDKRISRRNRAYQSLARCPTIPLSSPAGQLLVRTTKTCVSKEYLNERLERVERFCHAPILTRSLAKPKYLEKKYSPNNIHCTYKKLSEQSNHMYIFPRRQFSQKRRTENFMFFNSPLIKKCRPISVRLKKITENEIKRKRKSPNAKLNIKLTRDTSRSSNWKISSSPSSEIIVDTIDLCSSDDELGDTKRAKEQLVEALVNQSVNSYCLKNPLTTITSMTSCGTNVIQSKLKKLKNRLNTSEVTLTSIDKTTSSCSIKSGKNSKSSSAVKNATTLFRTMTEQNNSSWFETNICCSNAIASSENGVAHLKPLQPSVFLFSNYVTSPLTVTSSNNNEMVMQRNPVIPENFNFKTQNQENHLKNSDNSSSNGKRASSTAFTSNTHSVEWLPPHGSNLTPCSSARNINSNSNISQSCIVDRDRTSKSLPLMQSFSSPSRVVSIDLTS